ncbi:unnamed protein product [Heterobilharzia americana]|nr:unnamed protein product [Heterobilharzia americana]
MIRVEHFLKENKRVLNELYFLECITVARNSDISISRLRNVIGKRYRELLDNFEELFPKTNTSIHFLFWGFLRAKIAAIFLDSEDSSKAQEVLLPCVNSSERCGLIGSLLHKIIEDDCLKVGCLAPEEVVIFNSIAGLLQTIFNVLAAIHVRYVQNKQYVTSFDDPMSWLCCAERVYRLYSKQNSFNTGPEFWDTLLCHKLYKEPEVNDFEDHNEPGLSIHRLMFEHGYTTTIFITAQV